MLYQPSVKLAEQMLKKLPTGLERTNGSAAVFSMPGSGMADPVFQKTTLPSSRSGNKAAYRSSLSMRVSGAITITADGSPHSGLTLRADSKNNHPPSAEPESIPL